MRRPDSRAQLVERPAHAAPEDSVHPRDVAIEGALAAEGIHRSLQERSGRDLGETPQGTRTFDQRAIRRHPADPQPREEHFREGAAVDDETAAVHRLQCDEELEWQGRHPSEEGLDVEHPRIQ